jgi:osmotically-inducible protein OsmY
VHLSGLVESEVERRAYEAAARAVGARGVENDMAVRNRAIAE